MVCFVCFWKVCFLKICFCMVFKRYVFACFLDGVFLNVFWNVWFLEVVLYVLKCVFCVFYVCRASMLFISAVMRYVFQITKTAGDPEKFVFTDFWDGPDRDGASF